MRGYLLDLGRGLDRSGALLSSAGEVCWGASEMLPGLLIGEVLETVENISVQASKQTAGHS